MEDRLVPVVDIKITAISRDVPRSRLQALVQSFNALRPFGFVAGRVNGKRRLFRP